MDNQNPTPFIATHPGSIIKDELEEIGLTQVDLASKLNIKPSQLNEIIKGKRPISADLAVLLENVFGSSAEFWMNLQSNYDLDLARIDERIIRTLKNNEIWDTIKSIIPIKLFKRYLSDSVVNNIEKIKVIYNISTIEELLEIKAQKNFSYFKISSRQKIIEENVHSWTVIAEYESSNVIVNKFYIENKESLFKELKELFYRNQDTINQTKSILAKYGVKLIYLPKFEGCPIDGYSFWKGENPTIAISLRYNKIDNFAFTIFHELGHVFLHLLNKRDQSFLDILKLNEDSIFEEEANDFALDNLISKEEWCAFKQNSFSDSLVNKFAEENKINPSIILGRYSFEANRYNLKSIIDRKIY